MTKPKTFEPKLFDYKNLCVLIAAVLIGVMIFLPLGVSDDGTLFSIAESAGISGDISASYASMQFAKENSAIAAYDTESLLLSCVKNIAGGVDTRAVAVVLGVILLLCIYFALKTAKTDLWWLNLLAAAFVLLIFIDQGYVGYFNSIHKEGILYLSMAGLFTSGYLMTREKQTVWPIWCFLLFGAALTYSATGYAFAGLLLIVFLVRAMMLGKKRAVKLTALFCALLMLAVTLLTPRWEAPLERKMNLYNAVFYGVTMTSDNFENDLVELGLSRELKVLGQTSYFDKSTTGITDEQLTTEFYNKMRYGKLIIFYIKHPGRMLELMSSAVQNGTTIKIPYLGNFPQETGKADGQASGFYTLYSTVKPRVIPNLFFIHLAFLLVYLVFMIRFRCRKDLKKGQKLLYEFYILLILLAVLFILLPVLFHGISNIAKTMFLYNVCFDLLLVSAIVGGAKILYERRKNLREKFGVTQ